MKAFDFDEAYEAVLERKRRRRAEEAASEPTRFTRFILGESDVAEITPIDTTIGLPVESTGIDVEWSGISTAEVFGDHRLNMEFNFEGPVSDELLRLLLLPKDLLDPGNTMDSSQWADTFEPNGHEPALSQETKLTGMEPRLSANHRKK